MVAVSRVNEGLVPATDGQVALTVQLLVELNGRSFRHLRSWAAGSRPKPEPQQVRMRLLGLIERFVAGGQITPEVLRERVPPRMAEGLGDDLRGAAGQEALRQITTQLAAVLLVEKLPSALERWFEGLRPRLLRGAPEIVPWFLSRVGSVRASDFMASWGLAISEEHAARMEPALRAQREAVEGGVKLFYERLRSEAPIDVIGLADAALDDFEDLTESLNEIKGQVVGLCPRCLAVSRHP
jgi:hypothetical protein